MEYRGEERAQGLAVARRRRWPRVLAWLLFAILVALAALWFARERLAGNVIDDLLADMDLPVRYDIVAIGPDRQVLANITVGDPSNPDLTIKRAVVNMRLRFGTPQITGVELIRPRLYGALRNGRVSFGLLDRVIYAEQTGEPFRLPDLNVRIADGRALLRSDYGNMGVKIVGQGNLRDGFSGVIGAVVPRFAPADCRGEDITLYSRIVISDEAPRFAGPLRASTLNCAGAQLSVNAATWQLRGSLDRTFVRGSVEGRLSTGRVAFADNRLAQVSGEAAVAIRDDGLFVADVDLAGRDARLGGVSVAQVGFDGSLRSANGFDSWRLTGDFSGEGVEGRSFLDGRLKQWRQATTDTLIAPLLAKLRNALMRQMPDSAVTGSVQANFDGRRTSLVLPEVRWRGGNGAVLLALSRMQIMTGPGPMIYRGGFATGGNDLPQIIGQLENTSGGATNVRLRMAEYASGDSRLAVPELDLRLDDGGFELSGLVLASGPLPGGQVEGLRLPVSGRLGVNGALRLWDDCVSPRFDRLSYANLTLNRDDLLLCPGSGSAIVQSDSGGTRVGVGTPALNLSGRLGETPIRLVTGPVGYALPPGGKAAGVLSARLLNVALGPEATAVRFVLDDLTAQIGSDVAGQFVGADVTLPAVPLDISEANGNWSWRNGTLAIDDGSLRLTDRQGDARFEPLVADGVTLTLADNIITARAPFRESDTNRQIVTADIRHDLTTGTGHADLIVDGIDFDDGLQPVDVTQLALGNIANARGRVTGQGRIDWTEQGVSSTGAISTESLDFAAAFGPVTGLAGTLEFTDLLNLETAPNQRLTIGEVNPGIPVSNGEIFITLRPGLRLEILDGAWPFLGGMLRLEPTSLTFGATEVRSFTLVITGLDAARVVERLGVGNLIATGTFDGRIPIVFDETGGRVASGVLRSRPPGGNVSYVGELTYRDLSPIANFAFDALRSLDYREMSVTLDGALEGEIVTRVRFDGVSQGPGARSNFITRRIAKLPFRFNVNIRAPFYQLIGSLKSLYDPAAVRDPRELGLIDADGDRLVPNPHAPLTPGATRDNIQPSESETVP